MNAMILSNENISVSLSSGEPCRFTKQLDNGNVAIIQVANPDNISNTQKFLREHRDIKIVRIAHAFISACNVFKIVFNNAMNKKEVYKKNTRRKKVKPTNQKNENWKTKRK